ncbi:tryptophan 7-halogenase [Trinickia sp. LjRoot230]|uniref:NAD(P)/FAD-dependent oxidoreductase n=1 Tax=Trinickia sp. LjRoot230 TaxID=3342288 RepID=UPI003ED09F0E
MLSTYCDVLIVGAGPAGCASALALSLAAPGCRVVVVDRASAQPFQIGESATPDVSALLRRLDVEGRLGLRGHRAYQGDLSLWGGDEPRFDHFLSRGVGHGWHLDRAAFDAQLCNEVRERGIELHRCAGIEAILPLNDGWGVRLRGLGSVSTRVVADAGGRRSPLATQLGVRRRKLDKLVALTIRTTHSLNLTGLSLVEAFTHGWWYAVVLPDGHTLVSLMTDRDIAVARGFHDWGAYVRAWRETRLLASHVPPPDKPPAAIHAFAAHSGCLERGAATNWIAVGDALMGWDPLTSSGISGALSDGLAAAPAIIDMLEGGCDGARAYVDRANVVFGRYLMERLQRYGAEPRWRDSAFWARRGQCPQAAAGNLRLQR